MCASTLTTGLPNNSILLQAHTRTSLESTPIQTTEAVVTAGRRCGRHREVEAVYGEGGRGAGCGGRITPSTIDPVQRSARRYANHKRNARKASADDLERHRVTTLAIQTNLSELTSVLKPKHYDAAFTKHFCKAVVTAASDL